MKTVRRLRRQVRTLTAEKQALQGLYCEAVTRLDTVVKLFDQRPPPAEAGMAAMRERHHAFMAECRARQQKGEA